LQSFYISSPFALPRLWFFPPVVILTIYHFFQPLILSNRIFLLPLVEVELESTWWEVKMFNTFGMSSSLRQVYTKKWWDNACNPDRLLLRSWPATSFGFLDAKDWHRGALVNLLITRRRRAPPLRSCKDLSQTFPPLGRFGDPPSSCFNLAQSVSPVSATGGWLSGHPTGRPDFRVFWSRG